MKRYLPAIAAALCCALASATPIKPVAGISDIELLKSDSHMTVQMKADPSVVHTGRDNLISVTPAFISGNDTLRLAPIVYAGRNAWNYEQRDRRLDTEALLCRAGKGKPVVYSKSVDFSKIGDKSRMELLIDTLSECNCNAPKGGSAPIADLDYRPRRFEPVFGYVTPKGNAEKRFNLSGRADVRFIVNRTNIDWHYADNRAELDKILKTIEAVRDNRDASVDSILLVGYASPEGSYANNVRLAKGRTEAVRDYVMKQSGFPRSVYHTDYVAEDWGGLRRWLAESDMAERDRMIAFIDDTTVPEPKRNDIFRERFPEQYPYLLKNVYPTLRHTDYRITYTVRQYTSIDEIREVMKTNPRNLSLNELYLLADSCQPGSAEYDEVFDLAAHLYPDSEAANLNAANSAMHRGELNAAARYLSRAGKGGAAEYARGILSALEGDYAQALKLFRAAQAAGETRAGAAISQLEALEAFNGNVRYLR